MKFLVALVLVSLLVLAWFMRKVEIHPRAQPAAEMPAETASPGGPSPGTAPVSLEGGRLPNITGIEIFPPVPSLSSVLTVRILAEAPDPASYRYRWTVNGKPVSDQPVLPLKDFRQGDVVNLDVTAYNNSQEGFPVKGPAVKIGNNPPVISAVKISPLEPKAGQEIQAEVQATDLDNDPITFSYQWKVNGQLVEEATGSTLDGKFVRSADQIAVIVTPSDPYSQGTAQVSQTVLVANLPPEITSSPPTEVKEGTYTYQVEAKDPDGDTVSYHLLEGPPGMTLDAASGLLTWKVTSLQEKAHVSLQADDAKGGKSLQQFYVQAP